MPIKIEKIKDSGKRTIQADREEFLSIIKNIEVGYSFLLPKLHSYHRATLTIARSLLDRDYATRSCKDGVRVTRVS